MIWFRYPRAVALFSLAVSCTSDPAAVVSEDGPAADASPADAGEPAADADADDAAVEPGTLSGDVQPIFDTACDGNSCHTGATPARGLDLTDAQSTLAFTVNVLSDQCTSVRLVDPGSPETSYLMWKIEGSGPCFIGRRMPRGTPQPPPLTDLEQALIRSWIADGAQNN